MAVGAYSAHSDRYVLDGGFATELVQQGYDVNDDPLWGCRFLHTSPEVVKSVHKRFIRAGSDIIETNTYQASIGGLSNHLGVSAEESRNIITKATMLARESIEECNTNRTVRVAGSVGPYGACLCDGSEYTGNYMNTITEQDLKEWHRPRMECLVNSGVDMLAFDTIPSLEEARILMQLLREFPNTEAWLSFSCKDGQHTCSGDLFSEAVKLAHCSDQILAVGINCTAPCHIQPLLQSAQHFKLYKPFVAYPNSGEKWSSEKHWYGGQQLGKLSGSVKIWLDLGVQFIGGCCRVGPDDIANIKSQVNLYNDKNKIMLK